MTEAPAAGGAKSLTTTTEAATTNGPAWRAVSVEGRSAGAGKDGANIVARREAGFYFPPKNEQRGAGAARGDDLRRAEPARAQVDQEPIF